MVLILSPNKQNQRSGLALQVYRNNVWCTFQLNLVGIWEIQDHILLAKSVWVLLNGNEFMISEDFDKSFFFFVMYLFVCF